MDQACISLAELWGFLHLTGSQFPQLPSVSGRLLRLKKTWTWISPWEGSQRERPPTLLFCLAHTPHWCHLSEMQIQSLCLPSHTSPVPLYIIKTPYRGSQGFHDQLPLLFWSNLLLQSTALLPTIRNHTHFSLNVPFPLNPSLFMHQDPCLGFLPLSCPSGEHPVILRGNSDRRHSAEALMPVGSLLSGQSHWSHVPAVAMASLRRVVSSHVSLLDWGLSKSGSLTIPFFGSPARAWCWLMHIESQVLAA